MNTDSPLYGMTTAQLQAALTQAQTAYVALMSGQRTVSLSYSQGDGSKSVTYDRVEGGDEDAVLALLARVGRADDAWGVRGRRLERVGSSITIWSLPP